jgi:GT2 family glycosyltransferase
MNLTLIEPKIAIIIVNYNGGELLYKCLSYVEKQTIPAHRVYVVDNASHDNSIAQCEQAFPNVTFVKNDKNLGFAAGNNIAAKMATDCEWLAFLNPDAFAAPDWLEELIAAIKQFPDYDMFGCRMRDANRPELLDGTADIYHISGLAWRRDHQIANPNRNQFEEIFAACAAAALCKRDAFINAGGFDEDYFCYFEDVDLAFRLRIFGFRCLYVPTAVVDHVGSAISGKTSDFQVYHGHRNMVWTYIKNMPTSLFWLYLPMHLLMTIIMFGVCAKRGQAKVFIKAKWHALKGIPKFWQKRRAIQKQRKVSPVALSKLMTISLSRR